MKADPGPGTFLAETPAAQLKTLLLGPPRRTLAVAESVTCGGLQREIGRVSGASRYFLGGITAYDRPQKVAHLGVDDAEAKAANSVSQAIAEQMAKGVCVLFGSDVGVGTTGYAEPNTEWNVAAPFAYWAIARRDLAFPRVVKSGRIECPGWGRIEAQDRIAQAVLQELVAYFTA